MLEIYLTAYYQHEIDGIEHLVLGDAQLRTSVLLFNLVDQYIPILDKNAPDYLKRMQAFSRMKGRLPSIVIPSLRCLRESQIYTRSELKQSVSLLKESIPTAFPKLPADSRQFVLALLRKFANDPQMQYLKPELDVLLADVERLADSK